MVEIHVDFITRFPMVDSIRRYADPDLAKCLGMVYDDMVAKGCRTVRLHVRKLGMWRDAGTFSQDDIRGMMDESMCC